LKYLWLAISRVTRQVIGFFIGDRSTKSLSTKSLSIKSLSTKSLMLLWFSLPADYRRKLVYSDFYEAYAKWFASWQHRPGDKGSSKTSVVEGLNNKWRNRVSGLVRKTVCVRYISVCATLMTFKDGSGWSSKNTINSASDKSKSLSLDKSKSLSLQHLEIQYPEQQFMGIARRDNQ
jgi:IS1 family transposase